MVRGTSQATLVGQSLGNAAALRFFGMRFFGFFGTCPALPGEWGQAIVVGLGREEAGKRQPRGSRGRDTPVGG